MKKQRSISTDLATLRRKAEETMERKATDVGVPLSEVNSLKLVHELEVHQIELEMINEELKRAKFRSDFMAEKYTELYDFAPQGYFTLTADGAIVEANLMGAKMLGRDRPNLIKSHFAFYISVGTRPTFMLFLEKVFVNNEKWSCEVTLKTDDNPPIYCQLTGTLTSNRKHCLLIATDISELKYEQEAKKQSEEKFKSIFENIQDLYYQVDRHGIITEISPSCKHLSGYECEELIGTHVSILYNNIAERQNFLDFIAANGKVQDFELRMKTKQNEIKYLSFNANVVYDEAGRFSHIVGSGRDITMQKQAINSLTSSEARYRCLFESSKDGILILDADTGMILDVNPFLTELLGYTVDQLIEKTIWEVGFSHQIIGDKQKFEAFSQEAHFRTDELTLQASNGEFIDIEFVCNSYDVDGQRLIQCNIRDLRIRRKAEKEVQLMKRAIDQSTATVIITDREGNIEYANPKFTETTGYSVEEALGKNPRVLKSGEQPTEFYKQLWDSILSGQSWKGEFHNKKKSGEFYWENAIIAPVSNERGTITHFVAVKDDITEKKKMLDDLIKERNKAEESDRLKSAFLANMSHEIRTPMNGILGFAGLLKEPGLTGEAQHEYIQIIEKSGARMLNIINDIIDISKIEAGLMKLGIQNTNINQQLVYIHTFFLPEAALKGLVLTYNLDLPDHEAVISTDREKLYAILTNLVKNAIKFTDAGSIEIGYNCIRVFNQGHEAAIEFYVRDTGIGVPPDRRKAIFDRFVQADIDDTRAFQGAGLGLSISKAYVEMLGGRMWLESEEGIGSTFYFTLPCNVKTEEKPIDEFAQFKTEKDNKSIQLKILIVEDDTFSCTLITHYLKNYNRELLSVSNGIEAVKVCRENPDIDLILMDIKMKGMDGYEATRRIREFNKDVIIIAQTAYALHGDDENALDAGCNEHLAKPINKSALISTIGKFFRE